MPRNRFLEGLGRGVLRLGGWRMVGAFPDVPKAVLIAAPHSSNWDGIWGMAAKIAMGFQVRVLGKAQLFWWPLSPLLRKLGVVPVDRSSPQGTIEQAIAIIRDFDRIWFTLTPEGTRKRVDKWKTGFWKIARNANVPIVMGYFDYPDRIIGIDQVFHTSDNQQQDMVQIREFYRPWRGKNRGTV